MRPYLLVAAVVVLLPGPARAARPPPGVIVAEVIRAEFPLTIEALGTARSNESVEIRPEVNEKVAAVRFAEGQQVAAGAVLVELVDTESVARLAAARAALADSDSQYRRARELLATGLLPQSEVNPLAARREADQAALAAARARLADTVLRAPFAGRVGLRRVSVGSLVGPSVVITTLDDLATMKVDFDVPEVALGRLVEGLAITARSAAWPDTTFAGAVASIDTRVDPVSRSVTVRGHIPNPDNKLRPGMFLTVEVRTAATTALVIPEQAIVPEQSRTHVFVVGDGSVATKREVRTGRRRPGEVEILDGLVAGELVIAEGTQKARPGQAVEIVGRIGGGS